MSETPELLGGRYEVGKVLGRGGMAEVHLGRDLRLGRTVAIKILRADLARDPAFQARFRREAQSAASLNHPAVVAVYDNGEDSVGGIAVPFIVMEFVEGDTLRDLLNTGKRLVPERAMEVTAAVLTALEYSHRQGIVHRDIKPGNVMLTNDRSVKVMDFGIARALADTGAMTQTAAVMGTAQYLSPEQAKGEQVDARSDLYSTGCLLYELLTGRPPFTGDSPVSVAYQHVREEPKPPSTVDPEVSPAIDAVVMRSLAKDRDQRYQTAAEFRSDLERVIAGYAPAVAPGLSQAAYPGGGAEPHTQRIAPAVGGIPGGAAGGYTTGGPVGRGDQEPAVRGTSFWVTAALATLAVFVVAAIVGYFALSDGGEGSGSNATKVSVPSVTGLDITQAGRELDKVNLTAVPTRRASDEDVGKVLSQNPAANTQVDANTNVTLVVSSGPDSVEVPALVRLDRSAAEASLKNLGLLVEIDPTDSNLAKNQIFATSPEEGSSVKPGSTVTLQVATGFNTVPDLLDQKKEAARQELQRRGFAVSFEQQPSADKVDLVVDQDPSGGRRAINTTVTLSIGTAPDVSVPTTTTPTATPSDSTTPSASSSPTASVDPANP